MADDTGQEVKEQDPVQAIRAALSRALTSLKKLFTDEDEELQEELEEVEVASSGQAAAAPKTIAKPTVVAKTVKAEPSAKPAVSLDDPEDDEDI